MNKGEEEKERKKEEMEEEDKEKGHHHQRYYIMQIYAAISATLRKPIDVLPTDDVLAKAHRKPAYLLEISRWLLPYVLDCVDDRDAIAMPCPEEHASTQSLLELHKD
jgi:hypothetical protein